jgi:tight adherence protein B
MSTDQWPLLVGGGMCFGALLLVLLKLTTWRVPKARGLSLARGPGLSQMAQRAEAVTDNVLQRGGQASIIGDALDQAGLEVRPGEFIVVVCLVAAVAGVAATLALAPLAGLVVAPLVLVLSRVVVSLLGARRRKQFVDQLGETLQLLTGSLRAGNGLSQALDTVARESESPTSDEFRRVLIEVRLGRSLIESLRSLSDRMGSKDLVWVVQAIDINREIGGNLAEILDTISGTIRDRSRLRRQVSALTAEGKMSALVVMVLPFGLFGVMAAMNPTYLRPLYTTSTGLVLIGVAAALLSAGALWLRKLVNPVF